MAEAKRVVYERPDHTWGWRLFGDNGKDIIATDGGQSYEKESEARAMADKIINGHYKDADRRRKPLDD